MTDHAASPDAHPAAAATTASGRILDLDGWWNANRRHEQEKAHAVASENYQRLLAQAKGSDAGRQLQRCLPRWRTLFEHLRAPVLHCLADNQPVDPNDPDTWSARDGDMWRTGEELVAEAVLRRHGLTNIRASRLTKEAISALGVGQRDADRDAGLDWSTLTAPASQLDERLRRAHQGLATDLDDPAVWAYPQDQRAVLARRLALPAIQADDLSRWVIANPDRFEHQDLRCWRIGSPTWLNVADEQLAPVERVQQPVGVFVTPSAVQPGGWELTPCLSLDMIRLIIELGGHLERDLRHATVPLRAAAALVERVNARSLHAGPKEVLDAAGQLAQELHRELGIHVNPGLPTDKRDRWGRLKITRRDYRGKGATAEEQLALRVVTFPGREFTARRLGSAPIAQTADRGFVSASAVMDLGEAVQTAIERGLPLLLSTEAAGDLKDVVRVGRMKGRPGVLTITTSDGVSAKTRRLAADQALGELRALKRAEAKVTLDAGARQMVRMTQAQALEDDPVLLGRQREIAALKVVGSGVDASQTGTGKTISTGRALAHRAARTPRFRGLVIAEGRLLGQWRSELEHGAPARGLAPLAPNVQ